MSDPEIPEARGVGGAPEPPRARVRRVRAEAGAKRAEVAAAKLAAEMELRAKAEAATAQWRLEDPEATRMSAIGFLAETAAMARAKHQYGPAVAAAKAVLDALGAPPKRQDNQESTEMPKSKTELVAALRARADELERGT